MEKIIGYAIVDGDNIITQSNNGQLNIFETESQANDELHGPISTENDSDEFKILPVVISAKGEFTVRIAWDSHSTNVTGEHGFKLAEILNERGDSEINITSEIFDTAEERSAFIQGVNDAGGYDEPHTATEEDVQAEEDPTEDDINEIIGNNQ